MSCVFSRLLVFLIFRIFFLLSTPYKYRYNKWKGIKNIRTDWQRILTYLSKEQKKKKKVSSEFVKMNTTHFEVLVDISFDCVSSLESLSSSPLVGRTTSSATTSLSSISYKRKRKILRCINDDKDTLLILVDVGWFGIIINICRPTGFRFFVSIYTYFFNLILFYFFFTKI